MSTFGLKMSNIELILKRNIPAEKLDKIWPILFGGPLTSFEFSEAALKSSEGMRIELKGFTFDGKESKDNHEQIPRIVKVGVIQHKIVEPTHSSIDIQKKALLKHVGRMIDIAGKCKVNILCFPELWSKKFEF